MFHPFRYNIVVLPVGIDDTEVEEGTRGIAGYYDLNGRQVSGKHRGPIIIRYSDGTSRREIMK